MDRYRSGNERCAGHLLSHTQYVCYRNYFLHIRIFRAVLIGKQEWMDISKIKEAIESIFSSDGLQIAKFKFFCPPEISTGISKTDEGVSINFLDKLPYVKTRKLLIPITIEVLAWVRAQMFCHLEN